MTVYVRGCDVANLDTSTGTCTAEIWVPQPTVLPDLSIENAQDIGTQVALLWATAFAFRLVRKPLRS
jgi:hypothetical protein